MLMELTVDINDMELMSHLVRLSIDTRHLFGHIIIMRPYADPVIIKQLEPLVHRLAEAADGFGNRRSIMDNKMELYGPVIAGIGFDVMMSISMLTHAFTQTDMSMVSAEIQEQFNEIDQLLKDVTGALIESCKQLDKYKQAQVPVTDVQYHPLFTSKRFEA